MYKIVLCFLLVACVTCCYGQQYTVVTVKAGDDIDLHSSYRFPAFTTGVVKFKTGGVLTTRLNFNLLTCKMDFINPMGDTLAIAKPEEIAYIQVDSSTFYYDGAYREVFAQGDSMQLAVVRTMSVEPVKIGAMGIRNKNSSVDDYTWLLTHSGPNKLAADEDMDIRRKDSYLLLTANGERTANKSTFVKLFKPAKSDIESFIKKQKINFFKQADLEKLFVYCTQ
ncbi:MAG TPA: hypothetical protein VG738_09215 [Chitinophagaceae bacterium]|nr:hypothetical protein [Chitinophagaceae bacterium]